MSLFVIVLIGLLLRIYKLGKYSLWYDEAATLINSHHLKIMLGEFGKTITYPSPLYSIFIYFWQRLGTSETILRFPSVIFGILTVIMIYVVGNVLFNRKIGLTAAFLLSISPFNIYYSREVKGYAMLSFFVLLTVYFLIRAIRENKLKLWIGYCICMALNIYLHFVSIFILTVMSLYFLIFVRGSKSLFKKWLIANTSLLILLIPWIMNMILLLQKFYSSSNNQPWMPGWLRDLSFKYCFYTIKNFSAGYNAPFIISITITLLFAIFAIIGFFNSKNSKSIMLTCFCSFLPILLLYYFSKFIPTYCDRYLIYASSFYYMLVAHGFHFAKINKLTKNLMIILFLCLSAASLSAYYEENFASGFDACVAVVKKKDYRGAVQYLKDNIRDGDIIFHTSRTSTLPFVYYFEFYPDKFPARFLPALSSINKSIVLCFDKEKKAILPYEYREQKCEYIDRSQDINIYKQKRVWLIYSGWVLQNFTSTFSPETKIVSDIERNYKKIDSHYFDGLFIYLYE